MKFNLSKLFLFSILLVSCSKKAPEYLQNAELNLDEDQVEIAIDNLEMLVKKFPNDSLAAVAQYKLAGIYLNLKNDLTKGLSALEKTVNNYENSGYKSIQWYAKNEQKRKISSGVYLYTLQVGNNVGVKKMLLLE